MFKPQELYCLKILIVKKEDFVHLPLKIFNTQGRSLSNLSKWVIGLGIQILHKTLRLRVFLTPTAGEIRRTVDKLREKVRDSRR
jgi:hypothetical protein